MSDFNERDAIRIERKIAKAIHEKREKSQLDNYASEKIKNIYNFLDKVDSELESARGSHQFSSNTSRVFDEKENRLSVQNYSESRSNYMNTKIELEEAYKTIESLKKVVEKEKARNKELEIISEQREEKNLREQKEELEGIIQRHLAFIDQLVNDKKELNDQCEKLMAELHEIEGKHAKQMAELKDKFQRELKTTKDHWAASEKQRKEKWVQEKTSEIKEMTIKGLEPEIERILNKGKQDTKKLEDKHQKELADLREELYAEHEAKLRQYKEKILRENDENMTREREYLSNKAKEQYDKFEQKYMEDREKFKRMYETQIENVENERRKDKENFDEKIKTLQDENLKELRRVKEEYEEKLEEQKQKTKNEANRIKESTEEEQRKWFEKEDKRLKAEYETKLKEIKIALEKDRDEQIDIVISKLGEENVDAGFAIRDRYEKRIEEMKETHEEEIKKLKREIYVLDSQIKEGKAAKEAVGENLEVLSKKLIDIQTKLDLKEKECKGLKTALDSSKNEQERLLETQRDIELEWRKKMELQRIEVNAEREKMQQEMKETKRQYERELEGLEEKHANILEDVEQKVKKAISKKDGEIKGLKEELNLKNSACAKYEELLEKQRKQLFHA